MEKQIFEILQEVKDGKINLEIAQKKMLDLFYVMHCSPVKHPINMDGKENKKVTYCYRCGTTVRNQKFCHECGRKLIWNEL